MKTFAEELSSLLLGETDVKMTNPGTFEAHFRTGLIFLVLGFLWTYNNLLRYHAGRKEALRNGDEMKLRYKSSLFSMYHSNAKYVLAEPWIILIMCIVSSTIETLGAAFFNKPVVTVIHHVIMLSINGLMAVCAILRHHKYVVPPSAEHAVLLIANLSQAYLFLNHHKLGLHKKVHDTIALFNIATILCIACEMTYRRSVIAALGRTLLHIVQGFWWLLASVVLYPLSFMQWDAEEHVKNNILTSLAVIDVAVVLLIAIVMNFVVSKRVKNMSMGAVNRIVVLSGDSKYSSIENKGSEKYSYSDSDTEY